MEKSLRNFLYVFWILMGFSVITCIIIFVVQFQSSKISNDSAKWGAFGDYIGGISQSIFSLANLIIFVKLTNIISNYQQNQSEKELAFQKSLLMTQLRSEAIKDIRLVLYKFFDVVLNNDRKINDYAVLVGHINSFMLHNTHLFEMDEALNDAIRALVKLSKLKNSNDNSDEFLQLIEEFYNCRDRILLSLQSQMVDNLK